MTARLYVVIAVKGIAQVPLALTDCSRAVACSWLMVSSAPEHSHSCCQHCDTGQQGTQHGCLRLCSAGVYFHPPPPFDFCPVQLTVIVPCCRPPTDVRPCTRHSPTTKTGTTIAAASTPGCSLLLEPLRLAASICSVSKCVHVSMLQLSKQDVAT
jgi:hypothetical protein